MSEPDLGFIHRFHPAGNADAPPHTLLLLHGTGGNEDDLISVGQFLAPGAALLSVRGKVLENGMPRFFRRLAEGVFDQEDLRHRTHELADFVAAASQAYGFDPNRVVAVGYSNGANIAASMFLLRPSVLTAGVLFHPMVPFVPEPGPDLAGKKVFIGAGRYDNIAPPEQTEGLARILIGCGADLDVHWEAAGHGLSGEEAEAARDWLRSEVLHGV